MDVYLAGPMAEEAERGNVAAWRVDVQTEVKRQFPWLTINWLCPEVAGCDHRGIDLFGTAAQDVALIREADVILAWLDDINRAGTIAEIGMARALNKKIGVVVNREAHLFGLHPDMDEWPIEFYSKVTHTAHGCHCQLGDGLAGNMWFPMVLADYSTTYDLEAEVAPALARFLGLIVMAKEQLAWHIGWAKQL